MLARGSDTGGLGVQGLPEFPPAEGESRPMTFKRVLLNTCQEEFEGAQEAREVGWSFCPL